MVIMILALLLESRDRQYRRYVRRRKVLLTQ
jgi:hypothetical protein